MKLSAAALNKTADVRDACAKLELTIEWDGEVNLLTFLYRMFSGQDEDAKSKFFDWYADLKKERNENI